MPTNLRQNKKYIEVYVTWLYFVFMYIVPCVLLTVLNCLIYAEVSGTKNICTSQFFEGASSQGHQS